MKFAVIALVLSSIVLTVPAPILAAVDEGGGSTTTTQSTSCPAGQYRLGVPLGDLQCVPTGAGAFRAYVIGLYWYIVGLAVILASIVSTYAGYIYLTSGGDPARITHSRELIIGALSGLALLLLASTVLRLIGIGQTTQ